MTHGKSNKKKKILFCYNHLLYLRKLYFYIKEYNKDINYLYYELIDISKILIKLTKISKDFNEKIKLFFDEIFNDKYISNKIKEDIKNLLPFL